jgi:hypothetical protein
MLLFGVETMATRLPADARASKSVSMATKGLT